MKTLIISPSGDFYGSEQVLYDYLTHTDQQFELAVSQQGSFFGKLQSLKSVNSIISFDPKSLKYFYTKIFLGLLAGRYKKIYWNEGGHINYCLILAKLFPSIHFIVHIRIIEDTNIRRWFKQPSRNILLISVSKYIQNNLGFKSKLLYDPYSFQPGEYVRNVWSPEKKFRIGIIGRVTFSKGIELLDGLIQLVRKYDLEKFYSFHLIGNISEDVLNSSWLKKMEKESLVIFTGFLSNKSDLFNSIDCVLHLSKQEALGRIFLESLDAGLPFVGIDAGGIGEIGSLSGLKDNLANSASEDIPADLLKILELSRNNYALAKENVKNAKKNISAIISVPNYLQLLDKELIS